MIKEIKIKNFKTHEKTILKLHHGMNAIAGLPDKGKSNIRKSVLLVKDNRPSGFRYHSDFTDDPKTQVSITTNTDTVTFAKEKSKSSYQINSDEPLRKIGTSVPEEVSEKLNLLPINFSDQHDPPFLITASPSEIAKTINQYTKIDNINNCIKDINQQANATKTKKKYLEKEITKLNAKINKYRFVNRVEKYLKKAGVVNKKIEKNSQEIEWLIDTESSIKSINEFLKSKPQLEQAEKYIAEAEKIREKLKNNYSTLNILESAIQLKKVVTIARREKRIKIREYIAELKKQKICPSCLSPITNKCIEKIKEELK